MKFVTNKDIDLNKWDLAIRKDKRPLVFAQSYYLNACSPNWSALVKGDYESVMPVTSGKKLGIHYVLQPPFTPQLGVFGKKDHKFEKEAIEFLKENFRYVSVEFNSSMIFAKDFGTKRTYVLDSIDEFKLNSNTKRNISKANKAELKIRLVDGRDRLKLSEMYLNPFLKRTLKLKLKEIKIFNSLLLNAGNQNDLYTFVVEDTTTKIMAIAHFIFNGHHAVYLKGTTIGKDSGAMHFLMGSALHYFFDHKASQFDFGGGQSESLARFYSGFGAKPLTYYTFRFNNLPKPISWLKRK